MAAVGSRMAAARSRPVREKVRSAGVLSSGAGAAGAAGGAAGAFLGSLGLLPAASCSAVSAAGAGAGAGAGYSAGRESSVRMVRPW